MSFIMCTTPEEKACTNVGLHLVNQDDLDNVQVLPDGLCFNTPTNCGLATLMIQDGCITGTNLHIKHPGFCCDETKNDEQVKSMLLNISSLHATCMLLKSLYANARITTRFSSENSQRIKKNVFEIEVNFFVENNVNDDNCFWYQIHNGPLKRHPQQSGGDEYTLLYPIMITLSHAVLVNKPTFIYWLKKKNSSIPHTMLEFLDDIVGCNH